MCWYTSSSRCPRWHFLKVLKRGKVQRCSSAAPLDILVDSPACLTQPHLPGRQTEAEPKQDIYGHTYKHKTHLKHIHTQNAHTQTMAYTNPRIGTTLWYLTNTAGHVYLQNISSWVFERLAIRMAWEEPSPTLINPFVVAFLSQLFIIWIHSIKSNGFFDIQDTFSYTNMCTMYVLYMFRCIIYTICTWKTMKDFEETLNTLEDSEQP